jgi:hypothetical protein
MNVQCTLHNVSAVTSAVVHFCLQCVNPFRFAVVPLLQSCVALGDERYLETHHG